MENMETLLAAVAQTRGFDDDEPGASTAPELGLRSSEPKPVIRGDLNGLQLNGEGSGDVRPAAVVDTPPPAPASAISAVGLVTGAEQRRKRGRPPKVQNAAKPPPPKLQKLEDEEEDVCFICFDGGSLVLCDRKGCPKAYHPACIKRDEAFFRSKAKWNCGWHICSVCRKASYYLCYTCTYSLCKRCTKDADYLRVRGNKGFCSTCLKTIMLIENKDQPNESVQVDFDDQSSWEYLFKVYWVCLKEKLSLALSELNQAKQSCKGVPVVARKLQLNDVHHAVVDGKLPNSHRCTERLELNKPHVETSLQQNDGFRTALSRIDDYVQRIDCKNGEDGPSGDKDSTKPNKDSLTSEPGTQEATDKPGIEKDLDKLSVVKDAGNLCICKSTNNKELDQPGIERASQNNLNEYAAIDVHNINLIYLRRNLMEKLLEGRDDFNNKVIGSIVRIRTSSNDQKQDACRLVQVVGTSMVAEPYKIGERTANVMLEVLNLGKKEVVSIDAISNQEFTEDECRQLRQSIRCGIVKQITVGELQIKAMALQPVRINNWLEAEMLRLNNLRDGASENGRKKEPREYVDKLQLLPSPEECQRRIAEVPEIHADPKMSQNYESEEDNGSPENSDYVRRSLSGFSRNGRKPIAPNKKGEEEQPILSLNRMTEETDASGSHSSDKHVNKVHVTDSAVGDIDDQATPRSGFQTLTTTSSVGKSPSANNIETQKLWHYRDPNGKIRGPFSMMQLRTWSTTGLFLPDMRIWTNHEQYDSLLLTDALIGHLHGELDLSHKPSPGSRENGAIEVDKDTHGTSRYSKQTEAACSNRVSVLSDNDTGFVRENGTDSWPQCWDLLKDNDSSAGGAQASDVLPLSSNGQTDVALPVQDQENDEFNHGSRNGEKNLSGLTQNRMTSGDEHKNKCNNEDQASQFSEEKLRYLDTGLSLNHMESGSVVTPVSRSPDSSKQVGNIDVSDLPSPTPRTAENQQSVSGILELFSPTPRANNEDQGGHTTETKQSEISNFPVPDSGPTWSRASGPVGRVQLSDVADEWCGCSSIPVKTPVQEWDSGLASSSSLKHEVTDEYAASPSSDGHQITHAPPSHPASNMPNWLAILHEPIVFDALGEDSVSDLLAEADAVESQRALPSPTSAMKFVRELFEDCNDDCFSSIENFSPTPDPQRSDMFGSSGERQFSSQSLSAFKHAETFDAHDSLKKSSVNSSASSEGETIAPVHSGDAGSEFHPPAPNNTSQDVVGAPITTGSRSDAVDPGCGTVQGNINLVTVQGNVNLVLGGPAQGMANLGWGTNPGPTWVNPNINPSPINGSLSWDGQRKYGGERFTSPRERSYQGSDSGFGRGRPPRGRQPYGGGGYSRPLPKGQRVCKFYESGRCKKGAFCDYRHPA